MTAGRPRNLAVMAMVAAVLLGVAIVMDRAAAATPDGVTAISLSGLISGEAPRIGAPAPAFVATTVDGTAVNLADLRGHPVWLTFGASWCQSCRAEDPDIESAYQEFQANGLVVISVGITEDARSVGEYAARVGLTYANVADPGARLAASYRVFGIPWHFFVDRSGILRQIRIGSLGPDAMRAALADVMH